MMDRAYAQLTIKAVDEERRILTGIATTPSTDMYDDRVEPMGAEVKLPLPFLWQHDAAQPIGHVVKAKATAKGIEVEIHIAKIAEPGRLKDRIDEAWQSFKYGLVRGLSIGFKGIETAEIKGSYGTHYLRWLWLELSGVTIAANQDASLLTIKSLDTKLRAASGHTQRSVTSIPASRGNTKGSTVKTLKELQEAHETKSARQSEMVELRKGASDGMFSASEAAEFDALADDLNALDDEIRIKKFEERMATKSVTVRGDNADDAARSRKGLSFVRKNDPDDKFEGQSYIRQLKLKALSRLTHESVGALAEKLYGKSNPRFVLATKAAVAGGGTGSGEWGAELLDLNATFEGDFIEYLYGQTLFDQLPLTEIPANVRVNGQDGASTAYWTAQSKAIALTTMDTSSIDLTPLKVAALCVMSNELIEDSSPAADRLARNSLVEASAQKVDSTFFSTAAASAGVSPAGILNGVTAIQASGTDEAAVRLDLQSLLYPFVTAKMASGIVLAINPAQGLAIGSMINTFSMPSFVGINETGGTLGGRRVYAGDNVPPGMIIALRPRDIWKIGDSGVQISMSDVATIEMNDAPAGASDTPVAMASHAVSMFQTESTAIKVVRRINFQKRRSNAVTFVENAEYGGVAS